MCGLQTMLRIIYMIMRGFFRAIYYFCKIRKCGNDDSISRDEGFYWCKRGVVYANKAGKVTIEAHGLENLPKENGFVMFPNHQGLYDMLVFVESCPRTFAFVVKKEAAKIILLKEVTKALNSLALDREDIRQSMEVILTVIKRVKEGENFIIFPEGTRSRQGNKTLEFKAGTFKAAVKAKCPIVPCALIDSFKPFDVQSIKAVTVKIIYLPPLYYVEYKNMSTIEIAIEVKTRIDVAIAKYGGDEK